jgi:copper resistance protein B
MNIMRSGHPSDHPIDRRLRTSRTSTLALACVSAFALASHTHEAAAQHDHRAVTPLPSIANKTPAHEVDQDQDQRAQHDDRNRDRCGHEDHAQHDASSDSSHVERPSVVPETDPHAAHAPPAHAAERDTGAPNEQPKEPIPAITDADRTAAFPAVGAHSMHGDRAVAMLVVDRLEAWSHDGEPGQHWDLYGWLGGDLQRVWLRSEGEREDGVTTAANIELLYGRSVTPWWDVVAGVRHDFAPGASQDWAAFGVQGMAPYKFEVQATAYLGQNGRSAARLEAEYDVLLTNRLILQPVIELEFHDRRDLRRDTGAGLSTLEAGLRLRYEFTRRFAPYVGVVHERIKTADGQAQDENRLVGGLRLWF